MNHRLEDRIRDLLERLSKAEDRGDSTPFCVELREAMNKYIQRVRKRIAEYPPPVERRRW